MSLANVELVSGGSDRMIWSASSSSSTAWKGEGLQERGMLHWRHEWSSCLGGPTFGLWVGPWLPGTRSCRTSH